MHDKLMKMMKAKKMKGADMSDTEKDAKMSVLKDLQKMAAEAMSGRLHGLKKVTVAGDSPEAIEEGLDHAKSMLEGDEMEHEEHEAKESPEHEMMEDLHDGDMGEEESEDESEDDLDAKIQKLMELKKKKGMK